MKRETWITVTVQDPASGNLTQISARKGVCPNCGQSKCTKRDSMCIAVQKALKAGRFEFHSM